MASAAFEKSVQKAILDRIKPGAGLPIERMDDRLTGGIGND
jgi:hypothetical protein